MRWRCLVLVLTLTAASAAVAPIDGAVRGRLQVAPNHRYLQFTDGTPFFYLGDTAWELFHRLTREEADRYLEDRARKGFTVIQAVALAELDGLTVPNPYGALPLIDKDPARPNDAYFTHVDHIVSKAESLGMFVGLLPTWGKYWKTGEHLVFTRENARAYGRFLGQRYKDRAIIWILGGDQNVTTPDERAIVDAMAAGLEEGDGGTHLMTFHPRGPGQSSLQLQDASWLDVHMTQSSHGARDHDTGLYAERDLSLTPLRPTLDGEPRYESIPVGFYNRDYSRLDRFDDDDARQAAWWSVMAGACGHTYGNNNIWQMWQPGRAPIINAAIPWSRALDHPGATQMGYLRQLFESRPFMRLLRDTRLVLNAAHTGGAKIRSLRAGDGSFAFIYSPQGESFTVDKGLIRGPRVKEIWYDPRYGVAYEFHMSDNQGYQTYTPPSSGRGRDWVLILEDAAAGFPLPGQ
jgi:Protein of unknown function (DUF4038)/Putative collagen-binding domain of a collagenase